MYFDKNQITKFKHFGALRFMTFSDTLKYLRVSILMSQLSESPFLLPVRLEKMCG